MDLFGIQAYVHKLCDIGQYLDYKNCECRKKQIVKLVEECSEDIDGNEIIHNVNLNDYGKVCKSCTIYIVLLIITFMIIIGISSGFFYFHWLLSEEFINLAATYVKMLNYNKINVSEEIDVMIPMMAYELENIAILKVKVVDYRCVIWNMTGNYAINRLNNSGLDDKGSL